MFDNLTKYTETLDKLMSQYQVRMQNVQNLASLINIILTLVAAIGGGLIAIIMSNSMAKSLLVKLVRKLPKLLNHCDKN